jgi:secondary thiamine-phosphate synthase enzyme
VAAAGIASGWLLVFVPGSTGAVTTIEFESGCLEDLRRALERLAPRDGEYAHNLRWGDGNGYSHVRAALVGPSLNVPVHDGRPELGTWQQIVVCDFDNRPRRRRVLLELSGD